MPVIYIHPSFWCLVQYKHRSAIYFDCVRYTVTHFCSICVPFIWSSGHYYGVGMPLVVKAECCKKIFREVPLRTQQLWHLNHRSDTQKWKEPEFAVDKTRSTHFVFHLCKVCVCACVFPCASWACERKASAASFPVHCVWSVWMG